MIMTGFTPLNTEHCVLSDSRIDLWQFSLEHEVADANQLLNEDEKARARRFYFPKHARRFSTARVMMKIILSRYLNIRPARLEFSYNNYGKPAVINSQKLHFNLSHTGDLALLAVGKGITMGVDIEHYSARPYEGIAKNLFSDAELSEFLHLPASLKPAVFFHIWAQKEAFIKACGMGLSYPTKQFSVPTRIPTRQLIIDPMHNNTWQLHSFMPQIACSGALCYHPSVREVRYGVMQVKQSVDLNFDY
ncbi:MAG: 4'-phosphopantetheinyl transferase superfamily protein [Legionella sp.]|nr:4'-phosphopantetheinyl transferase superfamily protein [Legionella sp.]